MRWPTRRLGVGLVAVGVIVLLIVLVVDQWPQIEKRIRRATWRGVSDAQALGQLSARPHPPSLPAPPPGISKLGLGGAGERDGFLFVPSSYRADRPAKLLVMLHGAGGRGEKVLGHWRELAETHGFVVLAPDSREGTWDAMKYDQLGPDVAFLDRALAHVFERVNVDPAQVVLGGFSDGGSYTLGLGLLNGELFGRLVAFSPCWTDPPRGTGRPRVFVSHGTEDEILNVDECSRAIVPDLRARGHDVTYDEFHGPHTVPPEQKEHALVWLGW